MTTDAEYVLERLQYGPQDAMQIISASLRDRGVGLTVHSRVADLRAQGYTITCSIEGKTRKGRERYVYRLQERRGGGLACQLSSAAPLDAGFVEPPAVAAGPGAEIPALPDVIPGQLRLVG